MGSGGMSARLDFFFGIGGSGVAFSSWTVGKLGERSRSSDPLRGDPLVPESLADLVTVLFVLKLDRFGDTNGRSSSWYP